jgi:DNA-directed RNA polymerase subunit N (RpoN/RPB10)
MLTPIVCFTCGLPLGDVAPVYHSIRRKRMMEKYGKEDSTTAPTFASIETKEQKNMMKDVLDALGVDKCCRTHLVTAQLFTEQY